VYLHGASEYSACIMQVKLDFDLAACVQVLFRCPRAAFG
jgi:hypothetical protein